MQLNTFSGKVSTYIHRPTNCLSFDKLILINSHTKHEQYCSTGTAQKGYLLEKKQQKTKDEQSNPRTL